MLLNILLVASLAVSPASPGARPPELRHDLVLDGALTAAAWTWLALSETVLEESLAPATCRWCDRDARGVDTLNSLDRWGRGGRLGVHLAPLASDLSGWLGFLALPLGLTAVSVTMSLSEGRPLRDPAVDTLIVLESVGLAAALTQVTKLIAARERPFLRDAPDARGSSMDPRDENLSFFSGHTSIAFALATSAATVAELRGHRHAALFWLIGLPVATLVGALRVLADKHYVTDVVTGAAVGSAVGVGVVRLLHGRLPAGGGALTISAPTPGVVVVGGRI